jgi:hypothetical protein
MSRSRVEKTRKLLSSEAVEIVDVLAVKNADSYRQLKERLPVIECECGDEILLLPDLQAMNRAIEAHVAKHGQKGKNVKRNVFTSNKISQLLSQLSLMKISEQTDV